MVELFERGNVVTECIGGIWASVTTCCIFEASYTGISIFDGICTIRREKPPPFDKMKDELVNPADGEVTFDCDPRNVLFDKRPVVLSDAPFTDRSGKRIRGVLGFDVMEPNTGWTCWAPKRLTYYSQTLGYS